MLSEIAMQAGIYWFLAFGLWVNLRIVRYADLAVENMMIFAGMTTCWLTSQGWVGLSTIIPALACFAAGALSFGAVARFFWKTLRVPPIIVSLSLAYITYSLSLTAFGAAADGSNLPKLKKDYFGFTIVYGSLGFITLLFHIFRRSRTGRRVLAANGNPELATTLGINSGLWQLFTLVAASFLVMISGLFHAFYYTYVNIGDGVGFLLLGIFASILVANGFQRRITGFGNAVGILIAVVSYQSVLSLAIQTGLPISLTKGIMGAMLLFAVALLRFGKKDQPLVLG